MRVRPGRAASAGTVTLALGLLTVVLGFIGYREAVSSLDATGALYQALQLLVLDYHGPRSDPPWTLEVARFLGAFVLAYALLSVLVAIARERGDALRLRLTARGHFVVVGLGERGSVVVARLRAQRSATAVIESNRTAVRAPGARSRGALLVTGDARDRKVLEKARAARSGHVLIVAGDDSINLEIVAALEREVSDAGVAGPRVHAAVDDPYLWAQLHRRSLERQQRSGRVEFISFPDRIALKLVDGSREAVAGADAECVLVWGAGPVARRTAVHLVRRLLLSGRRPRLHLSGPDAADVQAQLFSSDPWIQEYTFSCDADGAGVEFDLAVVAGQQQADALSAAARLAEVQRSGTIVVGAPHDASETALAEAGYDVARIRLIAAEHVALDPSLFTESALDVIARAKHEDYVTQEVARGVAASENPSIASWEDLPANLQASNRFFAESVGEKLSSLGARLRPLATARPDAQFELPPRQLEELAVAEHDRWMRDLVDDGWQPTEGGKDPHRKLHPLLVPWAELDEEAREKDRDAIRALPSMLARIGYEIELAPRSDRLG